MKIGIHLPDISPEAGGASSLLKTIQKEIFESCDNDNEYFFLYDGKKSEPRVTKNESFFYINLSAYCSDIGFKQRIKNKIKRCLKMPVTAFSTIDAAVREVRIDLIWFTTPGLYEVSYPYIYTVWDLGHRRTPYFPEVSRSGWTWLDRETTYQKMLYKASYVITGNEEGKKEILESYPMPADKIHISPFPVASFCRGNEKKPDLEVPEHFFFYPAQFWPHKNHICVLNALIELRKKGMTPTVLFTGSDKGNKKYIESKIKEYGLEQQVFFTGFLSDEELKYLYTHATAMIYASLMGPNNMPPVEGTYLRCPVIITDLAGHKEQLKDTALYFNGYKPAELANHMETLLTSSAARSKIIAKQEEAARQFGSVNYFTEIRKIINEFSSIRKTWGTDFVHL